MSKTVLVTGCFGFVGSHMVDMLLEKDYKVLGVGTPRKEKDRNFSSFIHSPKFELIGEDVLKLDVKPEVSTEINTIFHFATSRASDNPKQLTEVNVIGTLNVLELARKADIQRVVFSSSAAVYGNPTNSPIREDTAMDPLNLYGVSKAAAEYYMKAYSRNYAIETSILRYFNVYGPRQSPNLGAISIFINQILRNLPITLEGDGRYRYTPIYVDDTAQATYLASQQPAAANETINICGSEILELRDIVRRIRELVPASRSSVIFKEPRPQWGDSQIGNTDTMRELLDFEPKCSLDESLPLTIEWFSQFL